MLFRIIGGVLLLSLAACAQGPLGSNAKPRPGQTSPAVTPAATAPVTVSIAPPKNAQTVDQFDTTSTAEKKAAAAAPPVPAEKRLGTTIASLGDPSDPGFWAETGLVDAVVQGRLEYPASGKSVQVELRPSGGPAGAGTRVSLPAMRVLEAPLTELPELIVFGG